MASAICNCGHVVDMHDRSGCRQWIVGIDVKCSCYGFLPSNLTCGRCGHAAHQHGNNGVGCCVDAGKLGCACGCLRFVRTDRWRGATDEEFFRELPS